MFIFLFCLFIFCMSIWSFNFELVHILGSHNIGVVLIISLIKIAEDVDGVLDLCF